MSIDIQSLATILREAAKAEVMPLFRRLAVGDIRQKTSAVDLVTEADEAAERFIKAKCAALWPDAVFVGEESTAADPRLLDAVAGADLAIVVDPIDGTANFAAGMPLFAVMAAVVAKGETIAGIIYDPLGDDFIMAEKGGGAVLMRPDGETVPLATAPTVPVEEMVGIASQAKLAAADRPNFLGRLAPVRIVANYRCSGHEYRMMASGHLHFSHYLHLMPWDHLAGALIVEEAGGHIRRTNGAVYRPGDIGGGLLCASTEANWQALHGTVFASV